MVRIKNEANTDKSFYSCKTVGLYSKNIIVAKDKEWLQNISRLQEVKMAQQQRPCKDLTQLNLGDIINDIHDITETSAKKNLSE